MSFSVTPCLRGRRPDPRRAKMSDHSTDEQFLRRALDLARQGIGIASPNPYVAAIIVDTQNRIVGSGVYTYDGVKHAEVHALEQAGEKARGATLYINLEPHSHQGRTPACTDALIAAGIHRVVASMPDPNPKVSGRGFEKLRAAGVHVEVGALEAEARRLNEAFARYIRKGIPLVTLKAAMTLDGKIAPPPSTGLEHTAGIPAGGWITGEAARANVHQQRHQSDAIMIGVGTVIADDPVLTDRSGCPRRRPLLRVIVDSHLRLPLDSRLVQSVTIAETSKSDVLVLCSAPDDGKKHDLEARGIRVEIVPPSADGRPDIHSILCRLGKFEITSVMIEGGSEVNATTLASGVVDKVFFYYAPKLAAAGAVPFASNLRCRLESEPLQVMQLSLHRFGDDFAVEGYLRDPYDE
ncbi:MAG: diaminohydroxyphosphoribosylaminopyrimidine deaminase [Acidobacteriaceae bacterium]